ncbi:hypothetical protein Salat_1631000 [Sesamum alatum]|uniref:GATA-type domain-containing protein n=1 Tax=Sesamum alatum TaxID=300844 RepID=A0AAE1Y606_9LAMI|nr:hypothetical protein Salat_1631000 [Sesamum alatum]
MRRQWPCSKCGYAGASTWRSLHTSKPVICNTCRSKGCRNTVAVNPPPPPPPPNPTTNDGRLPGNLLFDQISSSSTIIQENTTFTVSQIGMIFGNLPFEPSLPFPPTVHGHLQDQPMLKSQAAIEFQDHFYCRTSLKTSTSVVVEDGNIQIKQEYDCQQTLLEIANTCIWDPNKVQRKKRSTLPQYTLTPIARFVNQLQYHSSQYNPAVNFNFNFNVNDGSASNQVAYDHGPPKYDDFLIYEKCKYVADNEIGLGAVQLSSPASSSEPESSYSTSYDMDEESSSSDETSDSSDSNCLIDVPIRSSASE